VGCREQPTTVTGQVTLDGKPLAVEKGMRGTVVFEPQGGSGSTYNGNIDSTGRFDLAAGSSRLVLPGTYRVSISAIRIVPPNAEHPEQRGERVTPAKYATTAESGIAIEVAPGANDLTVPLLSDGSVSEAATEKSAGANIGMPAEDKRTGLEATNR
jgi:hypothetical protein